MISAALAVLEDEEQRNELSEIYSQNAGEFFSIAMSKLHNKQDAEEAVQEAFLAIANNPDCLFGIAKEKRVSYINVIIRNQAFKLWNYRNNIEKNEVSLSNVIADDELLVEERFSVGCSCEEIYDFIDTLPEASRAALTLKVNFGLKCSDIAKVLGMSEECVRKRIRRANGKIMEFVEGVRNGKVLYD